MLLPRELNKALAAFLPTVTHVLDLADRYALVRFAPGSPFEPRNLKQIQSLAPRIHEVTQSAAHTQLGLVDLFEMLSAFEPSSAKIQLSDEHISTLYALGLTKAGVLLPVVADVIGLFDEISPRAH